MTADTQERPSLHPRRRRLPHIEVAGATYFVTFRLSQSGLCDLTSPDLGPIIVGSLRHFHRVRYRLYDYVIMPDHVHAILRPSADAGQTEPLHRILGSIKWTAYRINRRLRRRGALWQEESYDHIIRNEADYQEKARYIWENPVRRGLVDDPANWPWWGRGEHGG